MHRFWKRRFVKAIAPKPNDSVLDVATGTGDNAAIFAKKVRNGGEVVGVDFSAAMISHARNRGKYALPNLRFEVGDAMDLRFASNMFDVASISFGIRNVDDPGAGVAEMRRVVKPGGRVAVLEFGQPIGVFGAFYQALFANVPSVCWRHYQREPGCLCLLRQNCCAFSKRGTVCRADAEKRVERCCGNSVAGGSWMDKPWSG